MIARGHWFPVYGLGNEYGIFYKKDIPTEYHWVEIENLDAIQHRRRFADVIMLFLNIFRCLHRQLPRTGVN